jgi:hypothetical protein
MASVINVQELEATMSKKSGRKGKSQPAPTPPTIHKATRAGLGRVVRGEAITEAEAVAERKAGMDVVVCGPDGRSNRNTAQRIENAVGPNRRQDPHASAGPYALPHFQPMNRPPDGHTFYEPQGKKAAKSP